MAATELLYRSDPRLAECEATVAAHADSGVVLDRTVFFAAGGGQPGDCGSIVADGRSYPVTDTVRDRASGDVVHVMDGDLPAIGSSAACSIDWDRRYRIMRTHTAMHLLYAAVQETVTGGSINPLRGRIDFDMPDPPDREAIAQRINEFVAADAPVATRWVDWDYLDSHPELVRTMAVAPPRTSGKVSLVEIDGIDVQACGGTHVARTGEVGAVRIAKVEKKGRLNRRIVIALDDS